MDMKMRLMVPGPTPIPSDVSAAASFPMIDERTASYEEIYLRVIANTRKVLLTNNDILLFASSITGASEGVLQNLFSPGDKVLVANNGHFGERWVQMGRTFGLNIIELSYDWGTPVDNQEIASVIAGDPDIKGAICIHCETSSGVVNDIKGFGQATRNVVSVVDGASSVGACELRTDEWGIDVVVSGVQKALMCPPGLSFVSISSRAWERHCASRMPRFYFDWDMAMPTGLSGYTSMPWTPAISLIVQFDIALIRILNEGLENVFQRHILLGRMARRGLSAIGLKLFSPDEDQHATVTTAWTPSAISARKLVQTLGAIHGLQVTTGLGHLSDKVFRLGHCGYVDPHDLITAISILEISLYQLGEKVELGRGVGAAQRIYCEEGVKYCQ